MLGMNQRLVTGSWYLIKGGLMDALQNLGDGNDLAGLDTNILRVLLSKVYGKYASLRVAVMQHPLV